MARVLILFIIISWTPPASAQQAPSADPALLKLHDKAGEENPAAATPTSLALSLAFSSATWLSVGISTQAPHVDIAQLLHRKLYRLELIELILLAERSGKTVAYLDSRHKKKVTLRALAEEVKVDFNRLYDDAVSMLRSIESRAEELSRVRAGSSSSYPSSDKTK